MNINGEIDTDDATSILQYIAGIIPKNSPDFDTELADVNIDNAIDTKDATCVLQKIAGILPSMLAHSLKSVL